MKIPPEEYIIGITERVHKDIFNLFLDNINFSSKVMILPKTKNMIESEIAELTVSLAKGLNSLVKYTKQYALDKHIQGTKDE